MNNINDFVEDDGLADNSSPPLSCLQCGKGFYNSNDLESHALQHEMFPKFDIQMKKYHKCEHCTASFPFKKNLDQHIQVVHSHIQFPFSCNYCGKTFSKQIYLDNHARGHTEKMHKCNICTKSFVRISLLKRHLTSHAEERPHKCTECGKTFRDSFDLKRHYRLHTGEKPFTCDFCGKGFPQKISLMFHLKTHTGEMPYKCNVCTKSFRKLTSLRNHSQIHYDLSAENTEKILSCLDCGFTVDTIADFDAHIESTHNLSYMNSNCDKENTEELDLKPMLCIYCGECFQKNEELEKHIQSHMDSLSDTKTVEAKPAVIQDKPVKGIVASTSDDDSKLYTCQECGCSFKTKSSCNRHVQMVHQEFICEICESLFQNIKQFQDHLPIHSEYLKENFIKTNTVFTCSYCNSNFSCEKKYKLHLSTHDTSKMYQCEFCDTCFINFEHLQNHRSTHLTDKKAYQCHLCDKSFVRSSTLFNHLQQHANSFFYKCKTCAKSFSSLKERDNHTRIHRGEVPYKCIDCGLGFYSSYKFKEHKIIHSENNQLVCLDCDVGFATVKMFARHKKLHQMGSFCDDDWTDEEWYQTN